MKSCAKCGKVVANGATMCPECGSFAFHTENGSEGFVIELLNMLLQKNPKLFWIIASILGAGMLAVIIWFCSMM